MNLNEMPAITASAYGGATSYIYNQQDQQTAVEPLRSLKSMRAFSMVPVGSDNSSFAQEYYQQFNESSYMSKRIVRVYLADTDENVPLASSVLHSTQEKLTDLTDQELFFEIPIQEVLAKHNALRVTLLDKKQTARSGRDTFLEPVKIRDLKMSVVTVASF